MKIVEHLSQITVALEELKIPYLVMGGHAVRYYGFNRETTDHDLHIPADAGRKLSDLLIHTSVFASDPPTESVTWRGADDFKRYVIGTLPDGKEELLEFWIHNHLLEDFDILYQRREEGLYGGKTVTFLSLPDLIRSKETERENDWQDISFLEEILDQRNLANAGDDREAVAALSALRSLKGLELAVKKELTTNQTNIEKALKNAPNPVTQAILLPFVPHVESELPGNEILPSAFRKHLIITEPVSSRHLALVEATRLRYKRSMQDIDRADKEKRL
ncbi:MAG: hypothetical protein KF855_09615 [Acidobacteria bacterium]|nr:hypothetical protein [Acidobacteriota bacterium]